MAKQAKNPPAITNRRARYDYQLGDELVVGIVLSGPEVRAARDSHMQLKGAYVTIKDDELWLINASFSVRHNQKGIAGARTVDTSPRKLLAHRKQIDTLIAQKKAGFSIIPLRLLNQQKHIKLVIALGKGKKKYDKRQVIKQRDIERDNKKFKR